MSNHFDYFNDHPAAHGGKVNDKQQQTMEEKLEYKLVKLIVLMQTQLELFDALQGTTAYKHNIKRSINMLSKDLEAYLSKMYVHLEMDREKEESFICITRGVEQILNTSVQELFEAGYKPLQ